ncbi:MAG: HK97 family phage prohead protease [Alphaproteobacteria bacterium]|nr:HK97 family phage prohead protease [Alphaproteobacteria bacterium]
MTMMRAAVAAQINALGENEVEVIISTSALARDGHILVPSGCDMTNYLANPIVLWQHNPDVPVGRAADLAIEGDKIRARIAFAPTGISPKADEVRGLVKNGIVSGVSVGFDVSESEPLDPKKPYGGQRFTKWELLECSFCSVPADPGAAVTARAQPQENRTMTNTQTRAGKKLSAATKKQLNDVADHLQRAMERHKSLGDQMNNIEEQNDGNSNNSADLSDLHEDASDTHRALGRSLKAAQRCLRTALKNKQPEDSDGEDNADAAGDDGDEEDAAGQDDSRSADLRRRKADLQALTQKH